MFGLWSTPQRGLCRQDLPMSRLGIGMMMMMMMIMVKCTRVALQASMRGMYLSLSQQTGLAPMDTARPCMPGIEIVWSHNLPPGGGGRRTWCLCAFLPSSGLNSVMLCTTTLPWPVAGQSSSPSPQPPPSVSLRFTAGLPSASSSSSSSSSTSCFLRFFASPSPAAATATEEPAGAETFPAAGLALNTPKRSSSSMPL